MFTCAQFLCVKEFYGFMTPDKLRLAFLPTPPGEAMVESERVSSDLPELDQREDPRGAGAAWALLAVGAAVIAGIIGAVIWIW